VTRGADDETNSLRSVADKVAEMEAALTTGQVATGTAFADQLVALTTELLDEIDRDARHDLERDAELISTLRVYRNAAFVFRRVADAGGEPDPAMRKLCASLIEQGHDHLRALIGETPPGDNTSKD
jgi:hypothetical protein